MILIPSSLPPDGFFCKIINYFIHTFTYCCGRDVNGCRNDFAGIQFLKWLNVCTCFMTPNEYRITYDNDFLLSGIYKRKMILYEQ